MILLTLNRDYFTSYCTLGHLSDPMGRRWPTIERPWIPNSYSCGEKGKSCVGLGEYKLRRYTSDAFTSVYALSAPALGVCVTEQEVPPHGKEWFRTRVLIHPANWASELRGCIAPGKVRAKGADGLWMVQRSRDAINEIRNVLGQSIDLVLNITSGGVT
jgi:Family of unknown function (DUF5675)